MHIIFSRILAPTGKTTPTDEQQQQLDHQQMCQIEQQLHQQLQQQFCVEQFQLLSQLQVFKDQIPFFLNSVNLLNLNKLVSLGLESATRSNTIGSTTIS